MLTQICPPGQQLRDWPMLQSSPQQRGAKLVVALLMQRFVGQQPNCPQHTCKDIMQLGQALNFGVQSGMHQPYRRAQPACRVCLSRGLWDNMLQLMGDALYASRSGLLMSLCIFQLALTGGCAQAIHMLAMLHALDPEVAAATPGPNRDPTTCVVRLNSPVP